MQRNRILVFTVVAVVALVAPALALHDGGVAHCNACHTMHNSQGSAAMNDNGLGVGLPVGQGYTNLLLFPNKTDVCLSCHSGTSGSYHVWTTSGAVGPQSAERGGGDFSFLEAPNLNDGHSGASNPILGHEAGHSLISIMRGTVADPTNVTAPGGTYPASQLACTSCHDPHGNDSFRLLYRSGQIGGGVIWSSTVVAQGIGTRDGAETNTNHNAYESGYSAWCGQCHGAFHNNSGNLIHPAGELLTTEIIDAYNSYNGTTDCIANPPVGPGLPCGSGLAATSYLDEVPFEDASVTLTSTTGPTAASRVACVTCHRAHATSAPDAGRWDFNITGLAEDGIESSSYAITNPYDAGQRSLCNKCHSKDEFDTPGVVFP